MINILRAQNGKGGQQVKMDINVSKETKNLTKNQTQMPKSENDKAKTWKNVKKKKKKKVNVQEL